MESGPQTGYRSLKGVTLTAPEWGRSSIGENIEWINSTGARGVYTDTGSWANKAEGRVALKKYNLNYIKTS